VGPLISRKLLKLESWN